MPTNATEEMLRLQLEPVRRALVYLQGSQGDKLFSKVIEEIIRQEKQKT